MLDWMRLLNISVHGTLYWRLLFMIPLLVAGMHILCCSKDNWTTLQIRVICLKNFQCLFSMPLCWSFAYTFKNWPSLESAHHIFLSCVIVLIWCSFVLHFSCSSELCWQSNVTIKLGCKLSLLFLTPVCSKLYVSLQSHCFLFLLLLLLLLLLFMVYKNFSFFSFG